MNMFTPEVANLTTYLQGRLVENLCIPVDNIAKVDSKFYSDNGRYYMTVQQAIDLLLASVNARTERIEALRARRKAICVDAKKARREHDETSFNRLGSLFVSVNDELQRLENLKCPPPITIRNTIGRILIAAANNTPLSY